MKKSVQTLYIILFAALIVLPIPVYALFGSRLADTSNYENREMASAPVIEQLSDLQTFPSDFDSWFGDNFPFRNELLKLNGKLEYYVLKSNNESVIIGKDGWLFYKGSQVNGEDPVADYEGTNLFTEEELAEIAGHLQAAKDDCEANGRQFIFMIGPNKEGIYSQYMPDIYGSPAQTSRIEQVTEYLAACTDVTVVNPKPAIKAYMEQYPEDQLYYKYDTHWNNLGSYIGGREIDAVLGIEMPELQDLQKTEGNVPPYDLAKLIHLVDVLNDDPAYILSGYTDKTVQLERNDELTEYRYTNDSPDADPRKIFIVGDSFSTMMGKYVACDFASLYENFYYNYTEEMLQDEDPDVVIYEVCERYLQNAKTFSLRESYKKE